MVHTRDSPQGETHRLKVRGWKNIFYASENKKTARVAILISDEIDFKAKSITKDTEGHYILIKGSVQVVITLTNIYTPDTEAPKIYKANTTQT